MTHYNFHYKTFQNAFWIRIFFHDLSKSSFFSNQNESISSTGENKFSALGELTALSAIKGYYEFLLEYPDINYQLRWQQTALPTVTKKSLGADIGLKIKFCTHQTEYFIGLMLSNNSFSYLDGSNLYLDNYRYSIGTIYYQDDDDNAYIPGPVLMVTDQNYKTINVNQVSLWLRIKQQLTLKHCTSFSYFLHYFSLVFSLNDFIQYIYLTHQ